MNRKYTDAEINKRIEYHMRQDGGILTSFEANEKHEQYLGVKIVTAINFKATILAPKLNSSMSFESDRFNDWDGFVKFLDKLEKIVK